MLDELLRRPSPRRLLVLVLLLGLLGTALSELKSGKTTLGAAQGEPTLLTQSFPSESECEEYRTSGVEGVPEIALDDVAEFAQDCLLLTPVSEPADHGGIGGVVIDEAAGVVCARVEQGPLRGSACTRTDADRPMIMALTGHYLEGSTHIIVVDPQRRLGSLSLSTGDGEVTASSVLEQGLWIQTVLPSTPNEIVVLDGAGQELSAVRPVEDRAGARDAAEQSIDEPPEEE